MSKVVALSTNRVLISKYFDQISEGMEGIAAHFVEVGKLVAQSERDLSPLEVQQLQKDLSERGVMGASTWSKFKAIGEKRLLHMRSNVKLLPPSWTTLYEMTAVPDKDLESAFKKNLIHPELQRSGIKALRKNLRAGKKPVSQGADEFCLGQIFVPKDLGSDVIQEFTRNLLEFADQYEVKVKVAEKPWKEYVLKEAEEELWNSLAEELTRMRGKGITKKRLKLYEDTMHQLRRHQETGKYLYRKQDPASIENAGHRFHGWDLSRFNQKLLEEKVITRYTDISYFTKEEGRLKCLALGYLYCTASNRRQQRSYLEKLQNTVRAGKRNAKHATQVIELIGE